MTASINVNAQPLCALVSTTDPAAAGLLLNEDGTVLLDEDGQPMHSEGQ